MDELTPETVALADLKPHHRNYRSHPDDQLEHIIESIEEHGVYRNVVIARDGTILAGHGVCQALARMERTHVRAIRLDLDPDEPRALKVLAGDNGIGHLAEEDDRALTELLKEIKDTDIDGLLGTGYDEKMLANLVFVTRPQAEIKDFGEAAEWVGLPDYDDGAPFLQMTVSFRSAEDRAAFAHALNLNVTDKTKSVWWPQKDREDLASLRVVG